MKKYFVFIILFACFYCIQAQHNVKYDPNGVSIRYAEFSPDSMTDLGIDELFYDLLNVKKENVFSQVAQYDLNSRYSYKDYFQYYKDYPVEDSKVILHYKDGSIIRMLGYYLPIENMNLNINLDTNDAKQIYLDHLEIENDPTFIFLIDTVIVEDTLSANLATLCYKMVLINLSDQITLYINVSNGTIVKEKKAPSAGVVGTLSTRHYGTKYCNNMINPFDENFYTLADDDRKVSIINGTFDGQRLLYSDPDNIWTQNNPEYPGYVQDVYWGAYNFVDYFRNHFNWQYFQWTPDGTIDPYTYTRFYIDSLSHTYWSRLNKYTITKAQNMESFVVIGTHNGYFKPMATIDIVAHEFAHAFYNMTCIAGATGANFHNTLEEACSDIWGAVLESVYAPEKDVWKIGEDVVKKTRENCIRDLANPQNDSAVVKMLGCYNIDSVDYNILHNDPTPGNMDNANYKNSGIISHWFYLLSEGGSGQNCDGLCYDIKGIGIDSAAKLFFLIESKYINDLSQGGLGMANCYEEFRDRTLIAAQDMYNGANCIEVKQVQKAWDAIGLYNQYLWYQNGYIPELHGLIVNSENVISENTLWDKKDVVYGNVVIDPNITLTITDTIGFGKNISITVMPGGKLVVDGGVLTSACHDEMWKGIRVLGCSTQRQIPQYQGTVELINGAIIENAIDAIITWDSVNYNTSGGIIYVNNAVFRNNLNAVSFINYTNHNSGGIPINNVSYFKNCDFIVNNDNLFSFQNLSFANHVRLWGVKGIKFEGCDFENNMAPLSFPLRGKGIYALNSTFTIDEYCPPTAYYTTDCTCSETSVRSFFKGFYRAIDVSITLKNYSVEVLRTDFENNTRGINLNGVHNPIIFRSDFKMPYINSYIPIGINFENCSGYEVEENNFYCTDSVSSVNSSFPKGVYVKNSGTAENLIYRNDFNKMGFAAYSCAINSGLQYHCNSFSNNYCGIYIDVSGSVKVFQGLNTKGADNDFFNNNQNIVNNGTSEIVYYYSNATEHNPSPSTGLISPVSNRPANLCNPSICSYESGGGELYSMSFSNDLILYDTLQSEYNKELNEFYAQGYDQVLNEISTNNANNFAVNTLNTSDDIAGSAVLIQQAMNQQNLLLSLSRQMADISDFNIQNLLMDSLLIFTSLEEWYSRVNTPVAKFSLVGNYYHAGDYEQAEATLQNIPNLFDFDDSETAEYNNFVAFYNFKNNIRLSGRNLAQLTGDEIAELETIATNTDGLSATMAKGVLCFFYNICFENEISEEVSPRNLFQNNAENETELSVIVYPNPTENQLNISFSASLTESAEMQIFDITGRCVKSLKLTNSFSTVNIDNLTNGIYFYRILYKENIISRDKIVKQ
jgi:hypothetical protein